MKDDKLYLIHIQECIERIEEYVADGKASFMQDKKTQDADLRNLHVLSESTQRLSENIKQEYSHVDWRAISGLRNVIVHNYLGVNLQRIWEIVEQNLPDLKADTAAILHDLG